MKVSFGDDAVVKTWQDDFPLQVKCVKCGDPDSRIAFVAHEFEATRKFAVCQLHESMPGALWPHDAIAVAVYFCPTCLEVTAKWNQA
jgi:hypothetical protein